MLLRAIRKSDARKLALAAQGFEVENVFVDDLWEDAERAGYPSCSQPNLKCKNATADWPKCVPPGDSYKLRFGQGSNFPIGAWWPPPTHEPSPELKAYVEANFTMVMVGDRDPEGCQDKDHYKDTWKMVMRQLDVVEEYGLQALIDGYVCSSWGGPQVQGDGAALPFFGEEENGPPGAWVDHAITHKPTPREVEYITQNLRHRKSVVGVLLADDASAAGLSYVSLQEAGRRGATAKVLRFQAVWRGHVARRQAPPERAASTMAHA